MALGWRGQYYKYREFSINLLAIYRQRNDIQSFLEIILSLSTLIIFIVFALKPTIVTMIGLTSEIKIKKETLSNLNQKISDLQKANNVFLEQQSVLPLVDTAVPTTPQPDVLAKQIYGLGTKNSVSILGISIGKTIIVGNALPATVKTEETEIKPLPGGAQAMPVIVNVKGEYKQLILFLKDIENLRIPVKIDDLVISASQLETGQILTEIITGRTPYLGKKN